MGDCDATDSTGPRTAGSRRAPQLLARAPNGLRIVSAHVGAGVSLCAIRDGISVDTTAGFTPLDCLMMATRSASIDPEIILWLLEQGTLTGSDIGNALEHESGLHGLSDSADIREIIERSRRG